MKGWHPDRDISNSFGRNKRKIYKEWFTKQMYDGGNGTYVDVVVIGEVKKFKEINAFPKNLKHFLSHNISLEAMINHGVSRQRLRDISDVFILDYINLNPDRWNGKNLVQSETRMIAFDNGESYRTTHSTITCPSLLHCPGHVFDKHIPLCNDTQVFCRFHAETIYLIYRVDPRTLTTFGEKLSTNVQKVLLDTMGISDRYSRLLYQNRHGLTRGKGLKHTFGNEIQRKLEKEPIPANYESYFGNFDLYEALDARIGYLLDYVESCFNKHGQKVFL